MAYDNKKEGVVLKIGFSVTDNKVSCVLDSRFGRCPYFMIVDTADNSKKWVENKGILAEGGAGIVAANQLVDLNLDIVITGNLGPNAWKVFQAANLKAYKTANIEIDKILADYKNGILEEVLFEDLKII